MFEKAKVENIKAKVLMAGPSGSGKTYSALRFASGLANGGKIGLIDTEAGRGKYYANKFEYFIRILEKHSPEDYIEVIKEAEKAGIEVLIIDSISHEWEFMNQLKDTMGGNSFQNWSKLTPRHDKLFRTILESKMHIICTVRGKDKYVLEPNHKGKMVPIKKNGGMVQRDTIEYEFTTVFQIESETNLASVSKDNTELFTGKEQVISETMGLDMFKWCDDGYNPDFEEIGTEKATLLSDFLLKKGISIEAALAVCKEHFNVESLKTLIKKDYDLLKCALREANYKIGDIKL